MIEYDYIFHQNSSFCFYSLCSKTGIHMVPIFRIISDRPCFLFQSNCDGIFDSGGLSIIWEELNVRFCLRYIITGLTGIDWWNIVMYSICRMIAIFDWILTLSIDNVTANTEQRMYTFVCPSLTSHGSERQLKHAVNERYKKRLNTYVTACC